MTKFKTKAQNIAIRLTQKLIDDDPTNRRAQLLQDALPTNMESALNSMYDYLYNNLEPAFTSREEPFTRVFANDEELRIQSLWRATLIREMKKSRNYGGGKLNPEELENERNKFCTTHLDNKNYTFDFHFWTREYYQNLPDSPVPMVEEVNYLNDLHLVTRANPLNINYEGDYLYCICKQEELQLLLQNGLLACQRGLTSKDYKPCNYHWSPHEAVRHFYGIGGYTGPLDQPGLHLICVKLQTTTMTKMNHFNRHYYEYNTYFPEKPHQLTSEELSSVTIFAVRSNIATTLKLFYDEGSEITEHIWDYTACIALLDIKKNYGADPLCTTWLNQLATDSSSELHYELNRDDSNRSVLNDVVPKDYVVKLIVRMTREEMQKKFNYLIDIVEKVNDDGNMHYTFPIRLRKKTYWLLDSLAKELFPRGNDSSESSSDFLQQTEENYEIIKGNSADDYSQEFEDRLRAILTKFSTVRNASTGL